MGMYAAAAYTTAHRLAPRDGVAGAAYRHLAAKWLRSLEITFAQKVRWDRRPWSLSADWPPAAHASP
jgi:hypothetical protein